MTTWIAALLMFGTLTFHGTVTVPPCPVQLDGHVSHARDCLRPARIIRRWPATGFPVMQGFVHPAYEWVIVYR